MCGIIGVFSFDDNIGEICFEGLKKLEYRGYDSAGISVLCNGIIETRKEVGKVHEVEEKTEFSKLKGSMGIAHTRWATTGSVTKSNTHPHRDCTGKIAVVHNGIVENFQNLKNSLIERGHNFQSETDTEVIAHLLEDKMKSGINFKNAVMQVGNSLEGRNAFVALNSDSCEMIAFRKGSPLIVGLKKDNGFSEVFVASDIQAFLHKTKQVMYLDDNQIVIINSSPEFYDSKTGEVIEKRLIQIDLDASEAQKQGHDHFMLKEIMDQKETLRKAINQDVSDLVHVAQEINNAKGVFFIGCGTAARVCHLAEYIFSEIADKHINFIPASEFENYKSFLLPETLVIAVSQSGETADVMSALEIAKEKNSKIISILNVPGSSMSKISDYNFLINAGIEKAVASTKATTSQIAVTILLAYACAGKLEEGVRTLADLAGEVNDMLNPRYSEHIKNLARQIVDSRNIFIIGRGFNYPLALESAIKIMEVSYIHAQGFAGGELKHGPIALIEKLTPVIALVANDDVKKEIISNAIEVKSRGAYIIGIAPENNEVFDYWIKTPDVEPETSPIVNLIPIQLLAYYLGILNGYDVDYPRSLAKSVTVK